MRRWVPFLTVIVVTAVACTQQTTPAENVPSTGASDITTSSTPCLAGVELVDDAGGLRAVFEGASIPSHQSFWFAWSQFHPTTLLWEG